MNRVCSIFFQLLQLFPLSVVRIESTAQNTLRNGELATSPAPRGRSEQTAGADVRRTSARYTS